MINYQFERRLVYTERDLKHCDFLRRSLLMMRGDGSLEKPAYIPVCLLNPMIESMIGSRLTSEVTDFS